MTADDKAKATRHELSAFMTGLQLLTEQTIGPITDHQKYLTFQGQVVKLVRVYKRKKRNRKEQDGTR